LRSRGCTRVRGWAVSTNVRCKRAWRGDDPPIPLPLRPFAPFPSVPLTIWQPMILFPPWRGNWQPFNLILLWLTNKNNCHTKPWNWDANTLHSCNELPNSTSFCKPDGLAVRLLYLFRPGLLGFPILYCVVFCFSCRPLGRPRTSGIRRVVQGVKES